MLLLVLGIMLFLSAHLMPSFPGYRAELVSRFGENAYKGIFSLVTIAGLALVANGKADAGFVGLWNPPGFGKTLAIPLMLLAVFLFISSGAPGNVKRFTPHPVGWSVILWSIAHLLANGDLASLLLFGSFGAFAVFSIISANRRGASKSDDKKPLKVDLIFAGVSVVIYGVVVYYHGSMFGVPLF